LFKILHAHLGPQVDVVEPALTEVTSQPPQIVEDTLATISISNTPREITPLTTFAPTGLSEERIRVPSTGQPRRDHEKKVLSLMHGD